MIALIPFTKKVTIYLTNILAVEYFKKNTAHFVIKHLTYQTFFFFDKLNVESVFINSRFTNYKSLRSAGLKYNLTNLLSVLTYITLVSLLIILCDKKIYAAGRGR